MKGWPEGASTCKSLVQTGRQILLNQSAFSRCARFVLVGVGALLVRIRCSSCDPEAWGALAVLAILGSDSLTTILESFKDVHNT